MLGNSLRVIFCLETTRLNNLWEFVIEALLTGRRHRLHLIMHGEEAYEELQNEPSSQFEPRDRLEANVVFALLILHFLILL